MADFNSLLQEIHALCFKVSTWSRETERREATEELILEANWIITRDKERKENEKAR